MNCVICKQEANSGNIIMGQGFTCSEECGQIAHGRRDAYLKELESEPLGTMPDKFETHDFERWMLKFAVHFIKSLDAVGRTKLAENNPFMLQPEHLSLEFKERVLRHIHKAYVSDVEFRGHARLFANGEYCFRQPVPAEKIVEALRKAELIGGAA